MDKKEISIQIAELEEATQELIEQYSDVRKTDAETIKSGRLKRIQIEIGRNAIKLKELNEQNV